MTEDDSTEDDSMNESKEDAETTLHYTKEELHIFSEFTYYKKCQRKKGNERKKLWRILTPGKWQKEINERIFTETKVPCGFSFRKSYLSVSEPSGSAYGNFMNYKYYILIFYYRSSENLIPRKETYSQLPVSNGLTTRG